LLPDQGVPLALPPGVPEAEWHGFRHFQRSVAPRPHIEVSADYGGPDEFPYPLAVIRQRVGATSWRYDIIELDADELRWLVEEVAPIVLERMAQRP
jgi:hypothetical protein